jgi:hypothetical protein
LRTGKTRKTQTSAAPRRTLLLLLLIRILMNLMIPTAADRCTQLAIQFACRRQDALEPMAPRSQRMVAARLIGCGFETWTSNCARRASLFRTPRPNVAPLIESNRQPYRHCNGALNPWHVTWHTDRSILNS